MTGSIVDLTAERTQRRMLAERAAESGEAFISGLQFAGRTFADLGWYLSAPVREHDKELTNGIYQLALQRLGRIVDDAIAEVSWASSSVTTTMAQARDVAFAAFTARMAALIEIEAEQKRSPSGEEGVTKPL